MNAHILCIGDELLIGQTINTNAAYIGALLTEAQIKVVKTSVTGDEEKAILEELAGAYKHADLIVITGGLGPTHDDITRSCIAKFFNSPLEQDEAILEDIRARFERLKRPMAKINESQALVPQAASAMQNKAGTAPGFWIERDGRIVVCMPGVPHEMKEMMREQVLPRLAVHISSERGFTASLNILTTGIAESVLFEKLGNLNDLLEGAKLAFLPSLAGVKMRITATAEDKESAMDKLTAIEQRIRSIAGRYIYGKNDEELPAVLGRILTERNLTLSIAESCTGGNICNLITNVGGSSAYFERGIISYSNAAKVELLKVDEDALQNFGAVSYEVARQMAAGVRSVSGTDIGLAITGILGPTGGSPEKPVGTVFLGICDESICTAVKIQLGDDRFINKQRATYAALGLLRKLLLRIPIDE